MKSKDVTHRVYSKTIVSAIILAFFISAVNLYAVDSTWQPDSGGSWGTTANWNNGVPDGTDDIARFVRDFTDAPTFTLDGSRTVNKLYYKDTGGTLRIGTISIGTAGTLTLGGSTKPEINVQGNNLILDVPIAGSNGFVKEGDKRLELLGDNTYSGVTEQRNGQISIRNKNAFGASTLEMYTGEIWQNVNVNAEGESVTNNIVLAGSAGSRGINKLSSKIRYSGVISGPSDIQLRSNGFAAGEIIFAGNNTFAGGFKNTAGSIRLGHNNGFGTGDVLWQDHDSLIYLRVEGDLARDGGAVTNNIILDMDNDDPQYNTFNVDTGGSYGGTKNSLRLAGVISGPNKLVKQGGNSLNLAGANTYSGGTVIDQGILIVQHINALGSGTLEMDNGSLWFDTPILDTGDGIQNDIVLNSGSFNFNTLGGNHRVKLSGVISGSGEISRNSFSGSTLILTGDNTFEGGFLERAGILLLGHTNALGRGALTWRCQYANDYLGTVADLSAGSGVPNEILLMSNLVVQVTNDLQLAGCISTSPAAEVVPQLIKRGESVLILSSTNTYTGSTVIEDGTLRLAATDALPSNGAVELAGGTLDMGAVTNTPSTLYVAADSALALGEGLLSFTNQSDTAWSGTLTLNGTLGDYALRFQPGLTQAQLDKISYAAANVYQTPEGYIRPVPPGTIIIVQ